MDIFLKYGESARPRLPIHGRPSSLLFLFGPFHGASALYHAFIYQWRELKNVLIFVTSTTLCIRQSYNIPVCIDLLFTPQTS